MKMVIVEIRGDTAVALREDGRFVTLRHQRYQVGDTIQGAAFRTSHHFSRFAAACIAAVLLIGVQTAMAVGMPYSYVTLDVNPSIQYTLNIFDRVLSVSAVNQDAASVVTALEKSGISFEKINDAIGQTVRQCRSEGYLSETAQEYVVFSVASKSDHKVENLSDQLEHFSQVDDLISTEVVPTTIREIKEAGQKGTTPGKLALISRMQKQTGDAQNAEAWINRPVREIMLKLSNNSSNSQASTADQTPAGQSSQQPAQNPQNSPQATEKASQSRTGSRSFADPYHSETSSETAGELSPQQSAESQKDLQASYVQPDSDIEANSEQSPQEAAAPPGDDSAAEAGIALETSSGNLPSAGNPENSASSPLNMPPQAGPSA